MSEGPEGQKIESRDPLVSLNELIYNMLIVLIYNMLNVVLFGHLFLKSNSFTIQSACSALFSIFNVFFILFFNQAVNKCKYLKCIT